MSMKHIFVVEDELNIRELIQFALEAYQYKVSAFETAEDALEALNTQTPDLAVFDIMLPGMDGVTAVKRIRADGKNRRLPIIFLTAKDTELDKVKGLDGGADDYMTKPFSTIELTARIRALLRRSNPDESEFFGELQLDRGARRVLVGETPADLTYKEYGLLTLLIDNAPNAVSREEIMEKIWGYDFIGESRTLDIHISSLRQKLRTEGKRIKTLRNVGYRFEKE